MVQFQFAKVPVSRVDPVKLRICINTGHKGGNYERLITGAVTARHGCYSESFPAKAPDPVFQRHPCLTERPRRTGSPAFADDDIGECRTAIANLARHAFALATLSASELLFRFRSLQAEGAGKAGCRSHPRPACNKKRRRQSPQVRAEQPAFPARWF